MIDFTGQLDRESQPNLQAIAPPPPAVKPPTLPTLLMQAIDVDKRLTAIEQAHHDIRTALIVLALLLFAVATELGVLLGQGR